MREGIFPMNGLILAATATAGGLVVLLIVWGVKKVLNISKRLRAVEAPRQGSHRDGDRNTPNFSMDSSGLQRRERELRAKERRQGERQRVLEEQERLLLREKEKLDSLMAETQERLGGVAGLSASAAKEQLLATVRKKAESEVANVQRQIEEDARKSGNEEARHIIDEALRRELPDGETLRFSVCMLPRHEVKSWIIGSRGRNIRAFESATGARLVISQFSDAVVIAAPEADTVRLTEQAIEELVAFGKITPEIILDKIAHLKEEFAEFFGGEEGPPEA